MTADAIDRCAVRQFNPIYGFYGRGGIPRPVKGPFCMALRPEHTKGAFSFLFHKNRRRSGVFPKQRRFLVDKKLFYEMTFGR